MDHVEYELLLENGDKDRPTTQIRRKPPVKASSNKGLKTAFLCLIICVLLLAMYTDTFFPIVDRIALQLGYRERQYAIVIDAGSTGSRVLAYEFHRGYLDGRLVLDKELFKELKPGLSSFVDNPKDGAAKINELLDVAKQFVPESLWPQTPLVLKATAGLRLLNPSKADNLLNSVRQLFATCGFLVDQTNAVEIMDGIDEGIYSWFTVNFLLGRLSSQNTVAALDLGGGSTQVTFVPKESSLYDGYIHNVPTFNGHINVFTHSYLGLGLMAARHAVFSNGYKKNETNLVNVCVNSIVQRKLFVYGGVEYYVSGKENKKSQDNPAVDYEACLEAVRDIVLPLVQPQPITLKQHPIAAFSYYFDRASENGLINPFEGGKINVEEFEKQAKDVCSIANTDQPFMCFDLTFINVLLRDGFGLKPQTQLKLNKKIDGHEISWALGCAYNILNANKKS